MALIQRLLQNPVVELEKAQLAIYIKIRVVQIWALFVFLGAGLRLAVLFFFGIALSSAGGGRR